VLKKTYFTKKRAVDLHRDDKKLTFLNHAVNLPANSMLMNSWILHQMGFKMGLLLLLYFITQTYLMCLDAHFHISSKWRE